MLQNRIRKKQAYTPDDYYGVCLFPGSYTGTSITTTESYGIINVMPITPKQLDYQKFNININQNN